MLVPEPGSSSWHRSDRRSEAPRHLLQAHPCPSLLTLFLNTRTIGHLTQPEWHVSACRGCYVFPGFAHFVVLTQCFELVRVVTSSGLWRHLPVCQLCGRTEVGLSHHCLPRTRLGMGSKCLQNEWGWRQASQRQELVLTQSVSQGQRMVPRMVATRCVHVQRNDGLSQKPSWALNTGSEVTCEN